MSLDALRVALQGLFPLTPIAVAVQGLLGGEPAPAPNEPQSLRPPVVGRGPGTTINASEWLEALRQKSKASTAPVQPPKQDRRRTRRRREEEALRLAAALLE